MATTSLPTAVKDMPKFGGEPSEFLPWKNSIEIVSSGSSDGIWNEVANILENPEKPEEEAKKTWIKNNGTFYSVLYFLTKGEATGSLYPYRAKRGEHKGDGIGAWKEILQKYEGSSVQRHVELSQKLDRISMRPGEDPDHFFTRIYNLRDQLRGLGQEVHDLRLVGLVINIVPKEYDAVRELHYKNDNYSLEEIRSTMRKIYQRRISEPSAQNRE